MRKVSDTSKKSKESEPSDKKAVRPPTYIGIDAMQDKNFNAKLVKLLENGFSQAGEDEEDINLLKTIAQNLKA